MRRLTLVAAGAALLAIAALIGVSRSSAKAATALPPPALDEANRTATTEAALLAGVSSAVSGYSGASATTAHYDEVETDATGHAQSVRIAYDPDRSSFGRIQQIDFSLVHDPTEQVYHGPDRGMRYRSTIFLTTEAQECREGVDRAPRSGARVLCPDCHHDRTRASSVRCNVCCLISIAANRRWPPLRGEMRDAFRQVDAGRYEHQRF